MSKIHKRKGQPAGLSMGGGDRPAQRTEAGRVWLVVAVLLLTATATARQTLQRAGCGSRQSTRRKKKKRKKKKRKKKEKKNLGVLPLLSALLRTYNVHAYFPNHRLYVRTYLVMYPRLSLRKKAAEEPSVVHSVLADTDGTCVNGCRDSQVHICPVGGRVSLAFSALLSRCGGREAVCSHN